MQLVERHRIKRHDPRWQVIDAAAWASKNLYNAALYQMRQIFCATNYIATYEELDVIMQPTPQYQALPRKVSQQVLQQLRDAWTNFLKARAEYGQQPAKFTGRPHPPHYLNTKKGRNLLTYMVVRSRV